MENEKVMPVIEARNLTMRYPQKGSCAIGRKKSAPAVDNVNLQVYLGETFGIVGESGCGKSTVARLLMALEKPSSGEVFFYGQRIDSLPERRRRLLRPKFQMVFQDSGASLNPRKRIYDILAEPLMYHGIVPRQELNARVEALLEMVGLPKEVKGRYAHEFSGGQRQRICIAKALSLNPELLILDEPVSALDVSVQAQVLNLLRHLQKQLNLTCIFIGHGLGTVRYVSHRIAVMYLGRIVEIGTAEEIFEHPLHPYTKALLDAAPIADPKQRERSRITLNGEISTEAVEEQACSFYHRCPYATRDCLLGQHQHLYPAAAGSGHLSACIPPESTGLDRKREEACAGM